MFFVLIAIGVVALTFNLGMKFAKAIDADPALRARLVDQAKRHYY